MFPIYRPPSSVETIGFSANLLANVLPMEQGHRHHEIELNFLFAGAATYRIGGKWTELAAGRIAIFWGAVPHSLVEVAPRTEMAWITLPLMMLFEWRLPQKFVRRVLEGDWIEEGGASPRGYAFREWVGEIQRGLTDVGSPVLLELQAAMMRIAGQPESRRSKEMRKAGGRFEAGGHVDRMARFIAEHFSENIEAKNVAKAAGLNPKYAMEVFRRGCGMTIHSYLRRQRITHAQHLLIEGEAKIIDVALDCGFQSLSAFYAAFATEVGQTPRAFRERFHKGEKYW